MHVHVSRQVSSADMPIVALVADSACPTLGGLAGERQICVLVCCTTYLYTTKHQSVSTRTKVVGVCVDDRPK